MLDALTILGLLVAGAAGVAVGWWLRRSSQEMSCKDEALLGQTIADSEGITNRIEQLARALAILDAKQ